MLLIAGSGSSGLCAHGRKPEFPPPAMKQLLSYLPNARFIVWSLTLTAIQICRWFDVGRLPIVSLLLIILALLATTPRDAVRVPRGISELLILCGSFSTQQHGGWVGVHLAIVVLMLFILRLWRKSAWWAVLFAWF